jgi:hypothetical protein
VEARPTSQPHYPDTTALSRSLTTLLSPRILACSQKVQRHLRRISHHPTIMARSSERASSLVDEHGCLSSVLVPDLSKVSLRNPNVIEGRFCVHPRWMARAVRRKVDHGKISCRIRCRSVVGETVRQGDLHLHVSYIVRRRRDEFVVGLVPGQCCSDRSPGRDVAIRSSSPSYAIWTSRCRRNWICT